MNNKQTGNVSEDFGKLILRVTLAILILFHGISKLIKGADGILAMVAKTGLPAEFGYLVYVGEVLAPLLILFGVMTRPAALIVAVNMVVAVALVHAAEIFTLAKTGGWALELQAMFLISALAVAFLGAGRYSVAGQGGRWN
ncbi:DoxX family protein [Noviherbaspirillum saxi]|uniref:DoxX family protein n=1 Tax=Noviherbaspirillum saxi TaxID=2320863 RepID=A0A3A3FHJ7_9BURK|nr:DoxX family protein [Noviherbaspirillum saxi]RJF94978.1 DoxX family protein [Noviherbaspirillum saxi]